MPTKEQLHESPREPAVKELARDPASRRRFLKMAGGTGAAGALSLFIAACGGDDDKTTSSASTTSSKPAGGAAADLKIANYALTLEYLEAEFYKEVIAAKIIKDKKVAAIAEKFGESEQAHVDALKALITKLGGTPVDAPKTNFQPVLDGGVDKVLQTAADVENLGAAAYLGQAGNITNKEMLAAALSIHSVEGRHAAALNTLLGKSVTPDGAFAKPAPMDMVLATVKPFLA
jgi:rubrerythrin